MSNDNSKPPPNKATYDPGWNDPPMFSYGATPPSAAGKSKLNLNKRVAFPLQSLGPATSSASSKTPLAASGLPMPFSGSIVTPPMNISQPPPSISTTANILPPPCTSALQPVGINQKIAIPTNEAIDEAEHQFYIITTLDSTIASLSPTNNTNEFKEIIKRIDILKSSYEKLDPKIQTILYNIAKSIDNKNISEATNFHRSLAVDYLNVCSQWAPALRQLILLAQPNEIIEDKQSENDLVPFYNHLSSIDTTANATKTSTTKSNFAKIYHI